MKKLLKLNPHALTISIAALIFVVLGALRAFHAKNDFVPVYAGTRCLLHGCNPYGTGELLYPPSTLLVLFPLALLDYPTAWLIWFLLNGALFVTAVVLVLSLCPRLHRWLATALGAVLLAGSSQLLILAQPSAFAVSTVVIGVYFFLRGQALLLGSILLTLSLAIKPQIGGLIVLYLFFKGIHRRYAAQAMAGTLTIILCGGLILRMHPQSADWVSDLRANLSMATAPGATDDPRPANGQASAALNLQTITSIFFSDEKGFNDAAYVIFTLLFAAWAVAALRMNPTMENHLLSLGVLSVLTLLPIYHRNYDSRFLILSIPAALIVYENRRFVGAFLCVLVALATVSIQHWIQLVLQKEGLLESVQQDRPLFTLLLRESGLRLLVLSCLFMVALFNIRAPKDSRRGQVVRSTN
jgi:Glycosyltransferase family 87